MVRGKVVTSSIAVLAALAGLIVFVASCGSDDGSVSAGGTGGAECSGSQVQCADDCGSDYFPASADCVAGKWVCPEGTVNPADCPAGTCWGAPLPCESCGASGWECHPDVMCVGTCGGIVCAECPANQPGQVHISGCLCECSASGTYSCAPAADCCQKDSDCSVDTVMPCVNGVCKTPVMGACWADVECPPGMVCQGAGVCGCGFACALPDQPGMCVPG